MDSKQLLEMVVKAADGRRAEDIVALKVDEISPMADYFVIMTGAQTVKYRRLRMPLLKKRMKKMSKLVALKVKIMLNGYWLTLVTWLSMFSVKKPVNSITLKNYGPTHPLSILTTGLMINDLSKFCPVI